MIVPRPLLAFWGTPDSLSFFLLLSFSLSSVSFSRAHNVVTMCRETLLRDYAYLGLINGALVIHLVLPLRGKKAAPEMRTFPFLRVKTGSKG